ncbi:hypothetical protein [Plantactinospora sp. GCM10030261]|uniref:hypothetical protein n=1 Tax=Plantactinospora sp. GCM10030261 TaxID=3273420 RepID=UPI0036221D0D
MTIPSEVLDSAAADPASPAWDHIWQESCHQGTCDPASVVLLPWLAQTCAAFIPENRENAVVLAGSIAVDASDTDRAAYADEITGALALDRLPCASNDSMFVYLQQAVLAFEGDEIWGKELDRINDGEVDVECPECEEELLLDLPSEDPPIQPGLSSDLAVRLHAEALQAGRESVATAFTYLFGRLNCPNCGTGFELAEHLAGVSYQ